MIQYKMDGIIRTGNGGTDHETHALSRVDRTFLISLSLPAAAAADASPFTDVSPDDYFYSPVLWAVGGDVTQGVSDGKFAPYTTCTRGQVVTFLWRAMGFPDSQNETNPFTDVRESDYFCKPVLWAVEQDITNGTSATAFSPEETCSCAHILTFLWRAMGKTEPGTPSPVSGRFPTRCMWRSSSRCRRAVRCS